MARRTSWKKARPGRMAEIAEVCLAQRNRDTYGRPLKGYTYIELAAMSAAQFAKVKKETMLPPVGTRHAPIRYLADGNVDECPCDECEALRADWRRRTGRD